MTRILIEGFTPEQLLELPDAELRALVLRDEPLVFSAGSATVLGAFRTAGDTLVLELAHIDEGGDSVLPALASLASRYAKRTGLAAIEWHVHAVHCARPNLDLRRVLERSGFVVRDVPGKGDCYWRRVELASGE